MREGREEKEEEKARGWKGKKKTLLFLLHQYT